MSSGDIGIDYILLNLYFILVFFYIIWAFLLDILHLWGCCFLAQVFVILLYLLRWKRCAAGCTLGGGGLFVPPGVFNNSSIATGTSVVEVFRI